MTNENINHTKQCQEEEEFLKTHPKTKNLVVVAQTSIVMGLIILMAVAGMYVFNPDMLNKFVGKNIKVTQVMIDEMAFDRSFRILPHDIYGKTAKIIQQKGQESKFDKAIAKKAGMLGFDTVVFAQVFISDVTPTPTIGGMEVGAFVNYVNGLGAGKVLAMLDNSAKVVITDPNWRSHIGGIRVSYTQSNKIPMTYDSNFMLIGLEDNGDFYFHTETSKKDLRGPWDTYMPWNTWKVPSIFKRKDI